MKLSINTILDGTLTVTIIDDVMLNTYLLNVLINESLLRRYNTKILSIEGNKLLYLNPSPGIKGIICENSDDLHLIRTLAVSIHKLMGLGDKLFIELYFKSYQTEKILTEYKTERINELQRNNNEVFFLPTQNWYLHRIIHTNESIAYQSIENLKLMAEPYAMEKFLN